MSEPRECCREAAKPEKWMKDAAKSYWSKYHGYNRIENEQNLAETIALFCPARQIIARHCHAEQGAVKKEENHDTRPEVASDIRNNQFSDCSVNCVPMVVDSAHHPGMEAKCDDLVAHSSDLAQRASSLAKGAAVVSDCGGANDYRYAQTPPAGERCPTMTNSQIKHMIDRFLGWRLPENFNPDGGISFVSTGNTGTPHEYKHNPTGTNLLDATQAEEMIRYMVEGMPHDKPADAPVAASPSHTEAPPTCTLCGTPMIFRCPACGSTPELTDTRYCRDCRAPVTGSVHVELVSGQKMCFVCFKRMDDPPKIEGPASSGASQGEK